MLLATSSGWEGAHLNIWSIEGERLDTYWAGTSAAWSPNSSRLASRGQVRDMTTGLPLVIIPEMYDQITWHPNGVWLASVADDQVFLWDAETGAAITTWPFEGCSINGFSWSANGSRFALGCIHGEDQSQNDLIIAEVIP